MRKLQVTCGYSLVFLETPVVSNYEQLVANYISPHCGIKSNDNQNYRFRLRDSPKIILFEESQSQVKVSAPNIKKTRTLNV